jgi:hypothetical protein
MPRSAVFLAAALLAAAAARAGPDEGDPLARFGWLRDLAGSCWRGTSADGQEMDTQCYATQFGRFLRGTIRIPVRRGGETVTFEGDSVFAWSEREGRIVYWLWSSDGGHRSGEVVREGEVIRFPDPRREGAAETRSTWTRVDAGSFRVVRERREADRWSEVLAVTYRRSPQ